jgi:Flp pilus assembly protein TadD
MVVDSDGTHAATSNDAKTALDKATQATKDLESGHADRAERLLREAIALDPACVKAHNTLGAAAYQKKDLYTAAREFQRACELSTDRPEPRNNLGLVYESGGQFPKAIEQYRAALAIDASSIEYKGNLARALWRCGDTSAETQALLDEIIESDQRQDWVLWARRAKASRRVPASISE